MPKIVTQFGIADVPARTPHPFLADERPDHPYDRALWDALHAAREAGTYKAGDEHLLGLMTLRMLHMARDAGRPSDAARSTGHAYVSDPVAFRASYARR